MWVKCKMDQELDKEFRMVQIRLLNIMERGRMMSMREKEPSTILDLATQETESISKTKRTSTKTGSNTPVTSKQENSMAPEQWFSLTQKY